MDIWAIDYESSTGNDISFLPHLPILLLLLQLLEKQETTARKLQGIRELPAKEVEESP